MDCETSKIRYKTVKDSIYDIQWCNLIIWTKCAQMESILMKNKLQANHMYIIHYFYTWCFSNLSKPQTIIKLHTSKHYMAYSFYNYLFHPQKNWDITYIPQHHGEFFGFAIFYGLFGAINLFNTRFFIVFLPNFQCHLSFYPH